MGLLDLFLQNATTLDVDPTPNQGNGPVGTPTGEFNTGAEPFQQVWDSNNTYINSFIGGTNNGIQPPTLSETGLDVDDPTFIPSTTTPNTLTLYPATAKGSLGQSALQFIQIWNPIINYNDVVAGTNNSILESTLSETSLDNTDPNNLNGLVPNSISIPNYYPTLVSGEFNGAPSQYSSPYNANNTYLDSNSINAQENTLDLTGLDNTNENSLPTTATPNVTVATPTVLPPQTYMGEFGGAPSTFTNIYSPNNGYLNNIEIQDPNSPQVNTLGETGLDNTDDTHLETTLSPLPVNIPVQPQLPLNITVAMNPSGSAIQFTQKYKPSNRYLDVVDALPIGDK